MKPKYSILILLCFALEAHSMPTKYNKCQSRLAIPQKSGGFYNSDDCNSIYVLPPKEGEIKLNGAALPSDLDCAAFDDLAKRKEQIDSNRNEIEAYRANKNVDDEQLKELKSECQPIYIKSTLTQAEIEELDLKLSSDLNDYEVLTARKTKCAENPNYIDEQKPKGLCDQVEQMLKTTKGKIVLIQTKQAAKAKEVENLKQQKNMCDNLIKARTDDLSATDQDYQVKKQQIDNAYAAWESDFAEFDSAGKTTGELSVGLFLNQEKTRDEFHRMNSALNFINMPINVGVINFQKMKSSVLGVSGKNQILSMNINGVSLEANDNQSNADIFKGSKNGILMGEAVGGSLSISNAAACNAKYLAKKNGNTENAELKKLIAQLAPTFTFSYGLQIGKKILVKYNEQHLYQLIKKVTQSKRLFSASQANQLLEKQEADKWIQIRIENEGSTTSTDDDFAIASDIRQAYLDNAIVRAANALYSNDTDSKPAVPGSTGAPEAAKALRKCPHLYCQYAAIAVDLISSISSSTTAESDMTKIVSSSAEEDISVKGPINNFGSTTFRAN